jgi:hypothetical protein
MPEKKQNNTRHYNISGGHTFYNPSCTSGYLTLSLALDKHTTSL